MTLRINCWSGPRNISTALMYSFRQRSDTTVIDEPFYAHYLRVSGRQHPGQEEILTSQNQNGEEVTKKILLGEYASPIVFFKQMCHHLIDIEIDFLTKCRNILLIREPKLVIRSHAKNVPDLQVSDIGLDIQTNLLNKLIDSGESPVVIESADLLARPESILREVSQNLEISFEHSMLSWDSGPKPEDGIWAKHWYENAHASTSFHSNTTNETPFPKNLESVLEQAQPLYDNLYQYALKGL